MRYIKYHYWLVLWKPWNFMDFPETVGNVIIPTDFHSIIFQGARSTTNQTCYETDVQPVYVFHVCHEENGPLGFNRFNHGRYPYRSYQTSQRSHNRNLVGGLEHYFSYIGNNHPNWLFYIFSEGLKPPTRVVCYPLVKQHIADGPAKCCTTKRMIETYWTTKSWDFYHLSTGGVRWPIHSSYGSPRDTHGWGNPKPRTRDELYTKRDHILWSLGLAWKNPEHIIAMYGIWGDVRLWFSRHSANQDPINVCFFCKPLVFSWTPNSRSW